MPRHLTLAACLTLALTAHAFAAPVQQDNVQVMGGGPGQFAGMERVTGEVTAVTATALIVKATDGTATTITVTDNTRILRGRGNAVKLADLKPGDGIMAMGNLDAPKKTLHAALIFATDAAQVKALKDNMGKTYITGRVTAIDLDNAKMTIERTDGVSQTIAFDETTSFKRTSGRFQRQNPDAASSTTPAAPPPPTTESITLADIKVGETVAGRGALKAGTFVPTELNVVPANPRRRP